MKILQLNKALKTGSYGPSGQTLENSAPNRPTSPALSSNLRPPTLHQGRSLKGTEVLHFDTMAKFGGDRNRSGQSRCGSGVGVTVDQFNEQFYPREVRSHFRSVLRSRHCLQTAAEKPLRSPLRSQHMCTGGKCHYCCCTDEIKDIESRIRCVKPNFLRFIPSSTGIIVAPSRCRDGSLFGGLMYGKWIDVASSSLQGYSGGALTFSRSYPSGAQSSLM
jgi:hypothetical protein